MRTTVSSALLAMLALTVTPVSQAAPLELVGPEFAGSFESAENGLRGIGLRADETFTIDSLGIFGDIVASDYTVAVRSSSNGSDAGGTLASTTAASGGLGNTWQDIALDFTFMAGEFYALQWGSASGIDWINSIDFYLDAPLPFDIGVVTLIDGYQADFGGADIFGNTLHPRLRFNIVEPNGVPEPGTLALLGIGIAGFVFTGRRRIR